MLYVSKTLLAAIKSAAPAAKEERRAAQVVETVSAEDAARPITDAIPRIIAERQLDGSTCAEVMTLIEGRDFKLRTWKDRKFAKEPSPEHLSDKAAAVLKWCAQQGLIAHLARFRGIQPRESAIVVEWSLPEDVAKELMTDAAPGAFIAELRERASAASARQALEAAAHRREQAMSVIAKVRQKCQENSDRGNHQALICTFETHGKVSADDLESLNFWVTDVARYCRTLGLTLRVLGHESKRTYECGFRDEREEYTSFSGALWVSWGTASN